MRQKILLISLLLCAIAARAQFTTVTGTVVDPNAVPYANGTIVPILVAPGGTSVTLGGFPYQPPSQPVGLDAAGKFVMRLGSTASLSPGGTGWNFQVCSAGATVGGGIGTGPQCFTLSAPISIAGASQDISTQLQAVALALSVPISGGGGGSVGGSGTTTFIPVWVSNTNLGNSPCSIIAGVQTCPALALSGIGPLTLSVTYGLTPTISSTGVSNLSVDPVNGLYAESVNGGGYVDFATGPQAAPGGNTNDIQANIGGSFGASDAYQIFTPVTPPGSNYLGTSPTAMIVGRVEPATNVLNQMSNVLQIQANYWTGTASAADIWWIYNGERPNGGNSRSTLVFNHTGSNGSANGSNYNVVFSGDNSADAAFSCAHEDPLFTTNSTMCLLVASVNTAGSGADMQVFNNATSGSGKTRIMQTSGIPGAGAITHFSETDPNVTASAEFGESIGPGGANYYPYLFINGVSTNLPSLYLGGSAFSGASGAALAIQLDNTFPCCGGPRRLVSAFPLTQIDFTAPSGADAVKPFQVLAGGTSSVNGAAVYDPTANNLHVGRNAADAIVALLTSTPVTGDCAEWTVASGSITIGDAGFACGSGGGGGSPGGSPDATQINGGGGTFVGVNSPIVNGLYQYVYNVTASAAVVPTTALPGVPVNAQSGAYPLVYSDRASYIKESGGSTATLTLPQVTGNTAANMPFVTQNLNSGNETLTANAADKIDNSGTGGSATLLPNFAAFVYQDGSSAPGNWWTIKVPTYAAFGATCANDGSHANVWSTTGGWSCVVIAGGGGGDMSTSSVNTMTGSGTIDMSALSVTTAFKPPAAAGAAPTTLGVVAFDTTNKVLQCGDGTNTNHCMESPIIFGFQQTGVLTGATSFGSLAGVNGYNATEVIRTAMLPFTGLMRALCVTTTNTQPASNSLAITLRDTTAAADTALTFTIAASSGAGTYCDNTHVVAITGQHSYSIKLVETGASTSATVAGGSAIYRY